MHSSTKGHPKEAEAFKSGRKDLTGLRRHILMYSVGNRQRSAELARCIAQPHCIVVQHTVISWA